MIKKTRIKNRIFYLFPIDDVFMFVSETDKQADTIKANLGKADGLKIYQNAIQSQLESATP